MNSLIPLGLSDFSKRNFSSIKELFISTIGPNIFPPEIVRQIAYYFLSEREHWRLTELLISFSSVKYFPTFEKCDASIPKYGFDPKIDSLILSRQDVVENLIVTSEFYQKPSAFRVKQLQFFLDQGYHLVQNSKHCYTYIQGKFKKFVEPSHQTVIHLTTMINFATTAGNVPFIRVLFEKFQLQFEHPFDNEKEDMIQQGKVLMERLIGEAISRGSIEIVQFLASFIERFDFPTYVQKIDFETTIEDYFPNFSPAYLGPFQRSVNGAVDLDFFKALYDFAKKYFSHAIGPFTKLLVKGNIPILAKKALLNYIIPHQDQQTNYVHSLVKHSIETENNGVFDYLLNQEDSAFHFSDLECAQASQNNYAFNKLAHMLKPMKTFITKRKAKKKPNLNFVVDDYDFKPKSKFFKGTNLQRIFRKYQ